MGARGGQRASPSRLSYQEDRVFGVKEYLLGDAPDQDLKIDLTDHQVVGRTPVAVDHVEFLGREGALSSAGRGSGTAPSSGTFSSATPP
jgi:hypothetical protein